jgi:hypothetical protein
MVRISLSASAGCQKRAGGPPGVHTIIEGTHCLQKVIDIAEESNELARRHPLVMSLIHCCTNPHEGSPLLCSWALLIPNARE